MLLFLRKFTVEKHFEKVTLHFFAQKAKREGQIFIESTLKTQTHIVFINFVA